MRCYSNLTFRTLENGRRADEPGAKLGIDNGATEIRRTLTIGCFP
jgi:hypothetical protein